MPGRQDSPASHVTKILMIDDDEDIARSLKIGLERSGSFSVDAYNDPVKAVENFRPGVYDVAILDIRMPGMNGFEVYRELKKSDGNLRVCFLTAFDIYEREFSKIFPEVNAAKFFTKPVSISFLANQVNQLVIVE